MNCRWICLCHMVAAMTSSSIGAANKLFNKEELRERTREKLAAKDDFPLRREELHALIREVAAKIEAKYQGQRPEADGLVQRVEEALAAATPPKADKDDRQLMLAEKMVAMNGYAGFKCLIGGVRGTIFDNSDTGHMQRYQDLESASVSDAEDVLRWLEMADAARRLEWQDKKETCTQRALGAARGLVSRRPKDAAAHALLGLALEWGDEKLSVLQTALKLDPKQPLALQEMLVRRIDQSFEKAVLRREVGLEEKFLATRMLAQALFDRPLTEEETLALERVQEEMRRDSRHLLVLAQERGDLAVYLTTMNKLTDIPRHHQMVELAARRGPEESFEAFWARVEGIWQNTIFDVVEDDTLVRTALEMAANDPEATGAIIMMSLLGDFMRKKPGSPPPKEPHMEIIRQTFTRLLVMAEADESLKAARAAEAAFIMEMCLKMTQKREPGHLDLLLRAVRLDPFRQCTQHMLMGVSLGMLSKAEDRPAGFALAQTELGLLPRLPTRRTCAAAASMVHDWPAAQRYLDACLRENPDDLGLLNQKAVTLLRESQSKAAQKKAQIYFHKIASLCEKPDAKPDKSDLELITRNHILFLMLGGKNDVARDELAKARREKTLEETQCGELEKLLP